MHQMKNKTPIVKTIRSKTAMPKKHLITKPHHLFINWSLPIQRLTNHLNMLFQMNVLAMSNTIANAIERIVTEDVVNV